MDHQRVLDLLAEHGPLLVEREWRFGLDDMVEFAGRAIEYTDGLIRAGRSALRWRGAARCGSRGSSSFVSSTVDVSAETFPAGAGRGLVAAVSRMNRRPG